MPDTEITRAETRERARLLLARSYNVDFDFTRGPHIFGSVSLIRFDCHQPGSSTHADLIAASVRAITLNGVPLDPATAWANGRITLPGLAASNELRVIADRAYTSSGTGMHRAESADGSVHIYAKLAQAYARTAYACYDQPDLKAVSTFRVTAPAGWVVLSNQPQADVERTLHDSRTVRFQPTPALPTFAATVVAGDYHVVTASHTTPGGQRIPLELACRAGLADRLDVDALLPLTARGLDYYASWLGADYPYAKYGQVFVTEFPHLASEDAGCVLIAERLLFQSSQSSQSSPALIKSRTGTALHEMAHMWFGDSATQEWWGDLWLSESLAEFCEAHAQVALGLNADTWSTMSFTMKIPAYRDDRLPSAHPVASDASTVSDTLTRVGGANVDVAGHRTAVPALLGTARPDLILLNDDDAGYLIVRFDPRSLATVLSSVDGLPDLPARAVCWNTVIDMVRQAELPVSAFAAMLARAMRSEKLPVLSALWQQADWLITRFAAPEQAAETGSLLETEAAWRLLTSETAGPVTVTAVTAGFMQPEHAALLAPYAGRYLAEMPDLWRTRAGHLRVRLATVLFPYPAVTPEFLTQLDRFLAASGAAPGLARIVRDHRYTAERALRARALLKIKD
jgi:Peptidase family M1 domain/ERAP1-like C-terminal domain/Peptidase M1 N-terminal domain